MSNGILEYDVKHELANVATHGLGLLASAVAAPFLILKASNNASLPEILGVLAFVGGLLAVYGTSTVYHAVFHKRTKQKLQTLDHIAIFLLIGGTYAGFILKFYNEPEGYIFMAVQWAIIVFSIAIRLFKPGLFQKISLLLYLAVGWMVVLIHDPVTQFMDAYTYYFLIAGGSFYCIGIIFFIWDKLPFNHAIWHVFVLLGSAGHFLSLYNAVG